MSKPIEIWVESLHPLDKPNKRRIASLARRILVSRRANLSLAIILVGDDFIQELNEKFRKKRAVTDVLSFGMNEGKKIGLETHHLGDVYICLDQAKRQARQYQVSCTEEIDRLVAHGILHLLGYDHRTKKQKQLMQRKEEYFMAHAGGERR